MTAAIIRPARPEDERALAELDAQSWPIELQVMPPSPASADFFRRRAIEDVIVAELDGVVVGYIQLAVHIPVPTNAHVIHINSLATLPSARGNGIGDRLVVAAIDEARMRGVRKIGLRALSINDRAIHIYEKHGFVLEGRLREEMLLPDGSYADDLWYALFL